MPLIRRALAIVIALLLLTVAVAQAQWPTTCVELNDIAEAAAGRHHNVGVYQRVAGANAEAACQHDHRTDVQRSFAWALGGSGGATVEGVWPTTCVALNDQSEAAAGQYQNVGIYQRVFADSAAAEAACRRDHLEDVRTTFRWAIREAATPAPVPTATPPKSETAAAHPDYERVRQAAAARGAKPAVAVSVAVDVIGRGSVDAFLRGTDDGVQYGRHACEYRSAACPLAPERPPPPPEPLIESAALPIWRMLASTTTGKALTERAAARGVRVIVSDRVAARSYADYSSSRNTVRLSPELLYERPQAAAVTLGHELWHAISPIPRPKNYDRCVIDEVWAFIIGAYVWYEMFGWADPWTDYEWDMWTTFRVFTDHPRGEVDFDQDVSDWPWMLNHVLFDRGYATSCQR